MKTLFTLRVTWALLIGIAVALLVVAGLSWSGVVYVTKQSSFCGGSCHVMDEAMASWQSSRHFADNNDRHLQAECIDCHFAPGEKATLRAQFRGLRHLAAYLYDPNAPLPIRAVMPEVACLQCHDRGELAAKEIRFLDKVPFRHGVHIDEEVLAGQRLTCDNCHVKVSAGKHFEVRKETCFLCHFKGANGAAVARSDPPSPGGAVQRVSTGMAVNGFGLAMPIDFLDGKSACDNCHEIPAKSLQRQKSVEDSKEGDKVITHQTLRDDNVPCGSCHFRVVSGDGAVQPGNVDAEGCLTCHNHAVGLLAKAADGREMHDRHVAGHRADCFECHAAVGHGPAEDHYRQARGDCLQCHDSEQHKYQQMLLEGVQVVDDLRGIPGLMDAVNTNCMGCHLDEKQQQGHTVRIGTGKACGGCHSKEQESMADDWKESVRREVNATREIHDEAVTAIKSAAQLPAESLEQARRLITQGEEILRVVEYGNGVHNKKYSILLLDEAFSRFERALDEASK